MNKVLTLLKLRRTCIGSSNFFESQRLCHLSVCCSKIVNSGIYRIYRAVAENINGANSIHTYRYGWSVGSLHNFSSGQPNTEYFFKFISRLDLFRKKFRCRISR